MKEEMLIMLTNDLVENREKFKEMKDDVSKLVERYDGKGIDWSYDEFCIKFINNLKRKNIKTNFTVEQMKMVFLDCMVEIGVEELHYRGKESESEILYRILKNKEYDYEKSSI